MNLNQIKKEATALTLADLTALRNYCNLILGQQENHRTTEVGVQSKSSPALRAVEAELLYEVLRGYLNRKFKAAYPFAGVYQKDSQNRALLKTATGTLVDFTSRAVGKFTRTDFLKMALLYSEVVCDDLHRMGVPPTVTSCLRRHKDWGILFDTQFPGYLEAGLARAVMRQLHVPEENV